MGLELIATSSCRCLRFRRRDERRMGVGSIGNDDGDNGVVVSLFHSSDASSYIGIFS